MISKQLVEIGKSTHNADSMISLKLFITSNNVDLESK